MGRLIDVDEIKKMYPIMENDFGMVVNERLHKNLDKIPTVEAIPLSVIDEIKAEINTKIQAHSSPKDDVFFCLDYAYRVIDEKIREYTE